MGRDRPRSGQGGEVAILPDLTELAPHFPTLLASGELSLPMEGGNAPYFFVQPPLVGL